MKQTEMLFDKHTRPSNILLKGSSLTHKGVLLSKRNPNKNLQFRLQQNWYWVSSDVTWCQMILAFFICGNKSIVPQ